MSTTTVLNTPRDVLKRFDAIEAKLNLLISNIQNNNSTFKLVNSYSDMLNININTNVILVFVSNDENKSQQNTIYLIWPNGIREWVAAIKDN